MSNNPVRAAILSLSGPVLSDQERDLFAQINPLGFILFARNCLDPEQVLRLCQDLRATVGRQDCPILIDQEGGRVQRLKPPHWSAYPAMQSFEAQPHGSSALQTCITDLACDLVRAGINVTCAPVLDVTCDETHDVIGDRAFSNDPDRVAALGRIVCDSLLANGVIPVIKHIPGHGRATADSHLKLPRVDVDLSILRATDFKPFQTIANSSIGRAVWAMTAHVLYPALDQDHPATTSRTIIETIIRKEIGFEGFLIGDDVDMKALSSYGDLVARAQACLAAGCDAVLYCSGILQDLHDLAGHLPPLSQKSLERLENSTQYLTKFQEAV